MSEILNSSSPVSRSGQAKAAPDTTGTIIDEKRGRLVFFSWLPGL